MATDPPPSVWIVVPCFNEAQRLPAEAFRAFSRQHPAIGFCFVDDGSTDATAEVLRALAGDGAPRMLALTLPANAGKAEAVRTGILHVLKRCAPEWVGYWDADLATPLEEIPRFIEVTGRIPDVAFLLGSRIRRIGADIRRKLTRHYLGRLFATCASLMIDLPAYDTQCGAKLIRAGLAASIFDRPFLSRWIFDVELLVRAMNELGPNRPRTALFELPLDRWTDVGDSRLRAIHFLRAPMELWRIRQTYRRRPPQ